jgi:uncharacterized paraquat-inducible protein A
MTGTLTERVQTLLHAEPRASIFRCPECGSFFDTPRIDPQTGTVARKCMSCEHWYPVATLRWEGSD